MRPAPPRSRILATSLAAACALTAACGGGPPAVQGSPVLTQVYWSSGGTQYLVWSLATDPALVSPVPPFASEVDFVFDRRLDGALLEDVVTVGGVMTVRPKDPPAVRASWDDMGTRMSTPPFKLIVDYNVLPRYGGVSSYVYAHPDVPGFPSGDTVTFTLVPARLKSATGEDATVPVKPIVVKTEAFSVAIGASTAPVQPSYQLPLTFSNRLPATPAASPLIHVRVGGAEVPYKLLADAGLASRWYLAAADCLGGGWPGGTTFTVTVDAGFGDAFGAGLAQATTATFSTAPGAAAPIDAACAVPEAGAPDAGVDAGPALDGGAPEIPEAGAPEGGVEAGTEPALDAAGEAERGDAD